MKNTLSILLLLVIGISSRANHSDEIQPSSTDATSVLPAPAELYFIQIASHTNPKFKDFKKVRSIGYLFEERTSNGISRIMMGAYTSKAHAKQKLAQVRAKGFKDAYLSKRTIKKEDAVYIVQMATVNQTDAIHWAHWERLAPKLCAELSDKKIRIASGPYLTKSEADMALAKVKKKGPKDAFVRLVSNKKIHQVTAFEKQTAASYKKKTKTARASIKILQQLLKAQTLYTDKVDGYWGPNTQKGVQAYKTSRINYKKYELLAQSSLYENKVKDYSLQYYINEVGNKPHVADEGLKQFEHPLAKVYRAYMYLNGDVPKQKAQVNTLMHEAIATVFSDYQGDTQYDFSMKYAYEDLDQLIKHLRAVHEAVKDEPDVPCWLFERHPHISAIAFAPYWNNNRDKYSVSFHCSPFMNMPEMRIAVTIAMDFSSNPTTYEGNLAKINQLYAAPQLVDREHAEKLERWNDQLWKGLQQWGLGSSLQARTYETLRFAYYDALRKVEDWYVNRGFSTSDARSLGLQVLKYALGASLDAYCAK